MPHSQISKAEQTARLNRFIGAFETAKRFGFTVAEVARMIDMKPRTLFRVLSGSRPLESFDVIQMQTVTITLLALQNKALRYPHFDIRKINP